MSVRTSNSFATKTKVFNDSVHGHIELHALSVKIIDTFEYQRLRDLKQLGGAYTVFPAASHNRFEHCLGVAHLARRFVTHLATAQPELGITHADALCLEIAGLIHDLGHGILSHLFDAKFIPTIVPDSEWEHEHASADMFDHLITRNGLLPYVAEAGLGPHDLYFIKELIFGSAKGAPKTWDWKGRGDKTFLYEIVANKRNGIDVDKWDYFQRDCRQLNMSVSFDAERLMKFARVLRGFDGLLQIAYPVKEAWHVYQMFQARYSLHKRAYQHKVSRCIETMYMEALIAADPYITVPAGEGVVNELDGTVTVRRLRMSQSIHDMDAYSRLSDYLLRTIACSMQPDLAKARDIIHRILRRDIYTWVGETLLPAFEEDRSKVGTSSSSRAGGAGPSSPADSEGGGSESAHHLMVTIPQGAPVALIGPDGFPHRLGTSSGVNSPSDLRSNTLPTALFSRTTSDGGVVGGADTNHHSNNSNNYHHANGSSSSSLTPSFPTAVATSLARDGRRGEEEEDYGGEQSPVSTTKNSPLLLAPASSSSPVVVVGEETQSSLRSTIIGGAAKTATTEVVAPIPIISRSSTISSSNSIPASVTTTNPAPPIVGKLKIVGGKLAFGPASVRSKVGGSVKNYSVVENNDDIEGIPLSQVAVIPLASESTVPQPAILPETKTTTTATPLPPPSSYSSSAVSPNQGSHTYSRVSNGAGGGAASMAAANTVPAMNRNSNSSSANSAAAAPAIRFKARRAWKEEDRLRITDALVGIAARLPPAEIEAAWHRYGYVQSPRAKARLGVIGGGRGIGARGLAAAAANRPLVAIPGNEDVESTSQNNIMNQGGDDEDDDDDENNNGIETAESVMERLVYPDLQNSSSSSSGKEKESAPKRARGGKLDESTDAALDASTLAAYAAADLDRFKSPGNNFIGAGGASGGHSTNMHGSSATGGGGGASSSAHGHGGEEEDLDENFAWIFTQGTATTTTTVSAQPVPLDEVLTADDILVDIVTINYGMGSRDPVEKVLFYEVDKRTGFLTPAKVRPNQVSIFVPSTFEEQYVRLYVKRKSIRHLATAAFDAWCRGAGSGSPTVFSPARKPKRRRAINEVAMEGEGGEKKQQHQQHQSEKGADDASRNTRSIFDGEAGNDTM